MKKVKIVAIFAGILLCFMFSITAGMIALVVGAFIFYAVFTQYRKRLQQTDLFDHYRIAGERKEAYDAILRETRGFLRSREWKGPKRKKVSKLTRKRKGTRKKKWK